VIRNAWLIPVFPLAAFFVILFFGKKLPGRGAPVGILAIALSWVFSLGSLYDIARGVEPVERAIDWFQVGGFHLEIGMAVDGLAAVMFVVVRATSSCRGRRGP
jgi:NADH-quinone oxidoreductase subunit L